MMPAVRRVGCWTLDGLTVLSLLLCVATVALWVRSHGSYDVIERSSCPANGLQPRLIARSGPGCLFLESERLGPPPPGATDAYFRPPGFSVAIAPPGALGLTFGEWAAQRPATTALGIGFRRYSLDADWQLAELAIRLIWPAVLFAALPALRGARWVHARRRAQRRRRSNQCARCSFDLTSNVSGVCPECGMAIAGGIT